MKRIFSALLFSAAILSQGLPVARAANPPRWFPFNFDRKTPVASLPAAPVKTAINDPAVELAAMRSRPVMVQASPAGPNVQKVNSRSLVIEFELKDLGPSGVGGVDLWYTRNGQTWHKCPEPAQTQSPFVQDVTEDGLYGFTVVASNGMGIGKPAPLPGEVPQMWVDVDTTNPEVRLLSTKAGADENGRTLTLRWSASDRNLVSRPIMLCYAEKPEGPWVPFATNLENTGTYTWHMSSGLPSHVLVCVQATDLVGNVNGDQSAMPLPVDLTRPTATIHKVSRNGVLVPVSGRE